MQDAQGTRYQTASICLAAFIGESLEGGKDVSQVKLPLRTAIIPEPACHISNAAAHVPAEGCIGVFCHGHTLHSSMELQSVPCCFYQQLHTSDYLQQKTIQKPLQQLTKWMWVCAFTASLFWPTKCCFILTLQDTTTKRVPSSQRLISKL